MYTVFQQRTLVVRNAPFYHVIYIMPQGTWLLIKILKLNFRNVSSRNFGPKISSKELNLSSCHCAISHTLSHLSTSYFPNQFNLHLQNPCGPIPILRPRFSIIRKCTFTSLLRSSTDIPCVLSFNIFSWIEVSVCHNLFIHSMFY